MLAARRLSERVPGGLELPIAYGVFLVLGVLISAPFPQSYDGRIMSQVALSLANHLTPLVHPTGDNFGLNTPWSGYGLGTSIFMAVTYKVGSLARVSEGKALVLFNAFLYAGIGCAVLTFLRRFGYPQRLRVVVSALIMLATPLLAYAATDFSEPGVALTIILGFIALQSISDGHRLGAVGLGAAVGVAVLIRTDSIVLVALPLLIAACVIARDRIRMLLLVGLGASPFAVIWLAYNAARYGSVFSVGYGLQPFNHGLIEGAYELALSPGRGVLIYVPILWLALSRLPAASGRVRFYSLLAVALMLIRIFFYARWWAWFGGGVWGPRFMVPALPALALPLAEALRAHRGPITILVCALSLSLSVLGLLTIKGKVANSYAEPNPVLPRGTPFIKVVTRPPYSTNVDDLMLSWRRFP